MKMLLTTMLIVLLLVQTRAQTSGCDLPNSVEKKDICGVCGGDATSCPMTWEKTSNLCYSLPEIVPSLGSKYDKQPIGDDKYGDVNNQAECQTACENNPNCHMYWHNHMRTIGRPPWTCWNFNLKSDYVRRHLLSGDFSLDVVSEEELSSRRRLPSYHRAHECWFKYGIQKTKEYWACTEHEILAITKECTCAAETTNCAAGSWCYDGACQTSAKYPVCIEDPYHSKKEACACGADTTVCGVDSWCYDGGCKETAKCALRTNKQSSIFYGAKFLGKWSGHESMRMKMNLTVPWDVTILNIKWKKAEDQNVLAYSDSKHGKWSLDETNVCKKTYELDIPQKEFFGPGSRFVIDNTQKMKTFLRVDAKESISVTKGNRMYHYDRNMHNDIPVLVQLRKVKTLETVHIHIVHRKRPPTNVTSTTCAPGDTSCVPPPEAGSEFVFFIDADETVDESTGDMTIAMKMKVYSLNCIATDSTNKGVEIKNGADKVDKDKLNKFEWLVDEKGYENDLCVETLKWSFAPAVIQDNTYSIDLEFTEKSTNFKFVARVDIEIKEEDVLTNMGFSETTTVYSDEECTTEQSKFALGSKFFIKIQLEEMVVNATSINCTNMTLTQGTDAARDLISEDKFNFYQSDTMNNAVVCGAELDSHDLQIKTDPGVQTDIDIIITVTYEQGAQKDTKTRRMLRNLRINPFNDIQENMFEKDMYEQGAGSEEVSVGGVGTYMRAPDKKNIGTQIEILPAFQDEILNVKSNAFAGSSSKIAIVVLVGGIFGIAYMCLKSKNEESKPLLEN